MPDGEDRDTLEGQAVSVLSSLSDIAPEAWDKCAGAENPFLSHAFLSALEESGSVTAKTGWLPRHLMIEDAAGTVLGVMPLYLKGHSYGEYVFDWGWADAWERAGGRYYPKLLSAVPLTPVTGPRLLVNPEAEREPVEAHLIGGLATLMEQLEVSSAHVNFPTASQWERLGEYGFLKRKGLQYHWTNDGYESFDDFLGALSSRKRKAIKKERRKVAETDLNIRCVTGDDLKPEHWDAFYAFYVDTSDRKWGSAYLTREFFDLLGERMADRVMLVLAEMENMPVAGALNLIGTDTLYGRNWGCLADFKFLHFEACYYQAIEFAIARGLKTVEAGAQGRHKIQRGYLPVETYSNHLIPNQSFRDAISDFLTSEARQIEAEKTYILEESPFRQDAPQS